MRELTEAHAPMEPFDQVEAEIRAVEGAAFNAGVRVRSSVLSELGLRPLGTGLAPRTHAMFALAGVAPPEGVIQCDSLAALTLLRHSDAVGIFPRPLLGHPETRDIVPVEHTRLRPCDIELLLLTRADVPLTPAASHFAHCLAQVSLQTTPVGSPIPDDNTK